MGLTGFNRARREAEQQEQTNDDSHEGLSLVPIDDPAAKTDASDKPEAETDASDKPEAETDASDKPVKPAKK